MAIIPAAVLLALRGWSQIMGLLPLPKLMKQFLGLVLAIWLVTIPQRVYQIPVPLGGTEKLVREASLWLKDSEYFHHKIYYYDPYFCHFMQLNPFDEERVRGFVYSREDPGLKIREGEIVIWDAHFSPNEGGLPLDRLMDHHGFRLVHLVRPARTFRVLGGYEYEIYIFQRIPEDQRVDNRQIYEQMLAEILEAG
jgi:hypothetical protein